jgi:hypothetical protein
LSIEIFSPLQSEVIRRIDITHGDIPKIIFDPLEVTEKPNFGEGEIHLNKDIENFSQRFREIRENVSNLNEKTMQFQNNDVYKKVSNYFKEKGFDVDESSYPKTYPVNTVLIQLLTNRLKPYWYLGEDFNLVLNNDELRINGSELVAKVSEDKKEVLEHHIQCLKQYHPICKEYETLIKDHNKILDESKKLAKEINENVISKIAIGDYKTTCNKCGWFSFLRNIKKRK